jgi:hypothetical protein
VSKTNKERVLDYVWAASPGGASNSEIQQGTGISSHQQVYMLTRELASAGWIQGERRGRGLVFWADESAGAQLCSPGAAHRGRLREKTLTPRAFLELARSTMSHHYGTPLSPGQVADVPWVFDLASADRGIVGCALYYALVQGQHLPPAKFSLITERVWLLEKTDALFAFLVFGYDREVPLLWRRRYGHMAPDVTFYYLDDDGSLERLEALA